MAKFFANAFVQRIAGAVGDLVVRKKNGRMFLSRKPEEVERAPSPGQIDVQNRFKRANSYACGAMRDPVKGPIYTQIAAARDSQAFALAMGDYFHPPAIDAIDLPAYHGKIGDKITVLATDDLRVVSVHILIRSTGGSTLEQGAASLVDGLWHYTATTNLPAGQPVTVVATATDLPGSTATSEKGFTPTA
jgi:hypothetical protein